MSLRVILVICLLLGIENLQAQETYQLRSAEISIQGTSSLHDWVSTSQQMTASAKLHVNAGSLADVAALRLTIPVTSFKSEKGSIMDKKTYKALLSDEHPNIIFKLEGVNSVAPKGDNALIRASGILTVAGQSNRIVVTAEARSDGNHSWHFTGQKALKMSDFGIDPPTALLGTLKTGDDITISFQLTLARGQTAN